TTAALAAVLRDRRALAVAAGGDGEHLALRIQLLHADHAVVRAKLDTLDAVGGTSHRAHLLFREADRQAPGGGEENVPVAVRFAHGEQAIALGVVDVDADDAALPRVGEGRESGLLHRALR